jgi:hypothetical protein
MKKITLALFVAGTLLALTSGANAADEMTEKMLQSLTGQWCQISGTSIHERNKSSGHNLFLLGVPLWDRMPC